MTKKSYIGTPEYEQGRAAFRGSISVDEAPHGEGEALDAWLDGYEFEQAMLKPALKRESLEGEKPKRG